MSELRESIRALHAEGKSYSRIAEALGRHPNTIYKHMRKLKIAAERGALGFEPVPPGYVVKQISARAANGAFVKMTKEPGEQFELPAGQTVKGVSALVDGDGREIIKWVKTAADKAPLADSVATIKEALAGCDLRAPPVLPAPAAVEEDLATVYIAADWHLGMMAWGKETGTSYDLPIARKTIGEAVTRLVIGSPRSKQAVVLGLGDLLHSDGYDNATAKSKHVLDVDGRYPKILHAATRLLVFTINLALEKHENVLVRVLPGNHDGESAIAVSLALAMFYENEPRVTVDDDPSYFWWWEWGSTLLGATHGDQAKMPDLPGIMAARNAEAWGRSKFRSVYTGHIHTQTGLEKHGVTVESFRTPAAADAWHSRMGYGAGRSMTSITHHRAFGEIGRQRSNIL